ncbi:hypothetical protein [Pseudothermotoga thermarum]|uniref:DRTGG domain-containing protein n=1 Tax=Pseudothermotoga thermarum DSM 5069 TaxID=688269 RepID=F7YU61_9THEM|nr:hypothetical protein [Pseudothermotoga thermarum]AEH50157.1 hypothetical protein Theth_0050 [Pseudothermotoga thermarum DSM 5069]
MKISEIVKKLGLQVCCGDCEQEITYGCVGDLLSDVMATAKPNSIWVTVQSHVNIVAVATISGIKAILLCNNHQYSHETLAKAQQEGLCLLRTSKSPFEVVGELYQMGVKP